VRLRNSHGNTISRTILTRTTCFRSRHALPPEHLCGLGKVEGTTQQTREGKQSQRKQLTNRTSVQSRRPRPDHVQAVRKTKQSKDCSVDVRLRSVQNSCDLRQWKCQTAA
jgi:hypothetical protein